MTMTDYMMLMERMTTIMTMTMTEKLFVMERMTTIVTMTVRKKMTSPPPQKKAHNNLFPSIFLSSAFMRGKTFI